MYYKETIPVTPFCGCKYIFYFVLFEHNSLDSERIILIEIIFTSYLGKISRNARSDGTCGTSCLRVQADA